MCVLSRIRRISKPYGCHCVRMVSVPDPTHFLNHGALWMIIVPKNIFVLRKKHAATFFNTRPQWNTWNKNTSPSKTLMPWSFSLWLRMQKSKNKYRIKFPTKYTHKFFFFKFSSPSKKFYFYFRFFFTGFFFSLPHTALTLSHRNNKQKFK